MTSRRDFMRSSMVSGAGLLLLPYLNFVDATHTQEELLELVNQVKKIAIKEFGLIPGKDAYTKWEKGAGLYNYLYVSRVDAIAPPKGFKNFKAFGTNEEKALKAKQEYDEQGFQTMLYKTAGTSSARLNKGLMSYRPESICFIVLHECVHRHLRKSGIRIPYVMEEALCDLYANEGTITIAKKGKSILNFQTSEHQRKTNERLYSMINRGLNYFTKHDVEGNRILLDGMQSELREILPEADSFQNQRFNYEISTAYLMRNRSYAQHYFLLKRLYKKQGNFQDTMKFLEDIPKEFSQTAWIIDEYLKAKN